jgi:glycosyltransferase involved in cell wall biosynthesis
MHILIAALHRPIQPTGICRHAANLARCLAENKEVTRISLVIGSWQKHYFETAFSLNFEKIKLITVNIKNSSVIRNSWFLSGLPQLANKLGSDIVHLSFPFPFLRASFKASVVTTIHDLYPYECPENFGFPQVWFNRLFLKQCISNSDGLACVSQVTLDKLKLYFPHLNPHKKIDVIYNYVDFESLKPKIPHKISENNLFLLSVAQHRQNKNLDLLIKAYSWLLDNKKLHPDTKLVIVGTSGPETQNLKNLISHLSLDNKVLLLAALDDSELCWLYKNCQVFIIPSSTEGFCLPLAEALYWSNLIVCSDIPIFKEIGTDKCTYFSLKNDAVTNLSQGIIQSINREKFSISTNVDRFEKSNVAKQYLNLYSRLMLERASQVLKKPREDKTWVNASKILDNGGSCPRIAEIVAEDNDATLLNKSK